MNFRSVFDFHHRTMCSIVHRASTHRSIFYVGITTAFLILFSGVVRSENVSQAKKAITKIFRKTT